MEGEPIGGYEVFGERENEKQRRLSRSNLRTGSYCSRDEEARDFEGKILRWGHTVFSSTTRSRSYRTDAYASPRKHEGRSEFE